MPGMDGTEATRPITTGPGTAHVIVLTTFDDDDYVSGALRAGASGFLVKDMVLDDILTAIRIVAAGDGLIASRSPTGSASAPPPPRYVTRLLSKLDARDRVQLVIAYETGMGAPTR